MTKELAKHMLDVVLRQSAELEELVRLLRDNADSDEFQKYREAIGQVLTDVLLGIINPVIAEHEDLRPPGLERL